MPSPFPGMNPYLEHPDVWHDFHDSVLPVIRGALAAKLAPAYVVKVEGRLVIHEWPGESGRTVGYADVAVNEDFGTRPSLDDGGLAMLTTPTRVRVEPTVEELTESFLEIRDTVGRDVITVIELLSPSNKYAGVDREAYLAKRNRILRSNVNFVEFDLLRGGQRMPVSGRPKGDYSILVSRAESRPDAELWGFSLRESLPMVPIPLRKGESNILLNLKSAIESTYDDAQYRHFIYRHDPQPTLTSEDAKWAAELLQSVGVTVN